MQKQNMHAVDTSLRDGLPEAWMAKCLETFSTAIHKSDPCVR